MAIRKNLPKREKKVPSVPHSDAPTPSDPRVLLSQDSSGGKPPTDITQNTPGLHKEVSKIFDGIQVPQNNDAANPPALPAPSGVEGPAQSDIEGPTTSEPVESEPILSKVEGAEPVEESPSTSSELRNAEEPAQSPPSFEYRPANIRSGSTMLTTGRKFPLTQKILVAGIILSAAILTYSLVFSPSNLPSPPQTPIEKTVKQNPPPQKDVQKFLTKRAVQPAAKTNSSQPHTLRAPLREIAQKKTNQTTTLAPKNSQDRTESETTSAQPFDIAPLDSALDRQDGQTPESASAPTPVSLRLADDYFAAKDYLRAYNACSKLSQNLTGKEFELVRDFLHLRMAMCLLQKSNTDKANEMLRNVCESPSIAIKVLANYNLCLLEMSSGRYLKARTRAYKTIALTGAIASDYKWALTIERDCQFLAAEAIARQTLSLSDADKELPKQLWYHADEKDPFAGLDEAELQKVLNAGMERFNNGLLAPQIQAIDSGAGSQILTRWSVICNGPGIEELMARFASNAGLDVKWAKRTDDSIATSRQPAGWNRAVMLYLPAATTQQFLSTAAGSVGLLALINDTNIITITDPGEYYTLSEHTRMLNEYSIWLWRKLLLMYSDDWRIANAHFMLGILQEQKEQVSEAITEYKLVASHYSKTPFAPFALLHSSRLKTGLRDYQGATRDLKQLIDQYPENELIGQAYLDLAETTLKSNMFEQACSLYRRAYNLALSNESKAIGALGAGKCFYQMKEYESALKWLTMYLETVNVQQPTAQKSAKPELKNNPNLYTAYILLGKTYLALGNLQQACETLKLTVQKANASEEYAEAIAALVETQMKQGDLVTALDTIENVRPWSFSQEQTTRLLVLKGAILRESGLAEQAIILLNDRIQYLTSSRLKADVTLELARCEIAVNHPELARSYLIEAIPTIEPGPIAQSASLDLADVCLKLNDYRQTISICKQLLDSSSSEEIKQKASKLLATAYSSQKDYNKAAMALLAASDRHNTSKENTLFEPRSGQTVDTPEK